MRRDIHECYLGQTLSALIDSARYHAMPQTVDRLTALQQWRDQPDRPVCVLAMPEGPFQYAVMGTLLVNEVGKPNGGLIAALYELRAALQAGEWYADHDVFNDRDLLDAWMMILPHFYDETPPPPGGLVHPIIEYVSTRTRRRSKTVLVTSWAPSDDEILGGLAEWYGKGFMRFIERSGVIIRLEDPTSNGGTGVVAARDRGTAPTGMGSWEHP